VRLYDSELTIHTVKSLLRRGRSHSPNSVGIYFTNAELLPSLLKYVISDGEVNLTILDSIRDSFTSRHSSLQRFNVCITHANLITSVGAVSVLLGHLRYEDSLPVELVLIFLVMPCDGPSQMPPSRSGTAKEI
jgi:hypothetical protein